MTSAPDLGTGPLGSSPAAPYVTPPRPARWPIFVWQLLPFPLVGLIASGFSAHNRKRQAAAQGQSTKGYWRTFWLSLVLPIVAAVLLMAFVVMSSESSGTLRSISTPQTIVSGDGQAAPSQGVEKPASAPAFPLAGTPVDTVRKIEAIRMSAFNTGTPSKLDLYWANPSYELAGYDYKNAAKPSTWGEKLKIKMVSFSPSQMVADVTFNYTNASGAVTNTEHIEVTYVVMMREGQYHWLAVKKTSLDSGE